MPNAITAINDFLDTHKISYTPYEHEPVFTVEEADSIAGHIEGVSAKTLLVFGEKTRDFYLISLEGHKKIEQKRIKELLGERVRFSTPEDLERILHVTPGSVSPLSLVFDTNTEIKKYVIDSTILESDLVTWHPNNNSQTWQFTQEMNQRFLDSIPHEKATY